ncbi:hypothetical protein ABB37_07767 [Leptomonas pyrrhocoris]|uniref:Uncharacterized protein n=1 Tax=Leptomonas pyrrhocoris TaxID=157538 RepID=A0A0N0VDT2_LEPPY|nr:hypothetical protein ABB37_07767 [Leptomonas pyrrhocoris]KPA76444.1 hypothetical protein ABB37_07767 [Leptomonas pyrrhocoris]|eukprot:XP_015654883.1 hypothetical protein ABB37_07767 [Leptomonas pyrrhocoris]
MSEQVPKRADQPPRFGGAPSSSKQKQQHRQQHDSKPPGKRPPMADQRKKKPAAPQDNVRYAVIITNVENDFGKLHNSALPYHCGLRADYEETLEVERLIHTSGVEAKNLISATRGCGYAVRCRTETRSAEVSFYGPADADFAPMQLQKQPRPGPGASATAGSSSQTTTTTTAATAASEPAPAVDPAAHTEDATAEQTGDHEVTETAAATTNALEALALRLRRMRYFEDKLPVHVHLPGHAAGDVLLRVNGDGKAEAEVQRTTETAATTIGEKRPRAAKDDNGDDGVDDATVEDEAEEEEEEGENAAQRLTTEGSGGGTVKQRRPKAKKAIVLKQFPNRQKDFVTAVAALSVHVPLRVVRRHLHDVPGYMSCWSLFAKRVRVVFRDRESLFKAKQLLDQFELTAGLRISLMLSDPLSQGNAEFVRAKEAAEAE